MLCGDHFNRQNLQIKESAPILNWPYLVNTTHLTIFASTAPATKPANLIKKPFSILDELDWSIVILQQNRHFQSNKWPSGVFCIPELFSETALFMQMSSVFSLASLQIYHFPRHTPVQLALPPSRTPDIAPGPQIFLPPCCQWAQQSFCSMSPWRPLFQLTLIYFLSLVAMPTPARRHDGDKLWTESSQSTPKPSFSTSYLP